MTETTILAGGAAAGPATLAVAEGQAAAPGTLQEATVGQPEAVGVSPREAVMEASHLAPEDPRRHPPTAVETSAVLAAATVPWWISSW